MFFVQLYRVELCNGEVMCSLCSLIMLSFVMGRHVFSVQLYRVELCNGEAMCSLCSLIMLSFVMGR